MTKTERTKGPWEYVPGTKHHGPYVRTRWGGDICDCYAMSNPAAASVLNGGTSYPINFQGEAADANAAFIVEACNSYDALRSALDYIQMHSNEKAIREKAASALSQTGAGA